MDVTGAEYLDITFTEFATQASDWVSAGCTNDFVEIYFHNSKAAIPSCGYECRKNGKMLRLTLNLEMLDAAKLVLCESDMEARRYCGEEPSTAPTNLTINSHSSCQRQLPKCTACKHCAKLL